MATPILFDFDNQADAQRSIKKVSQLMQRAGQPVVSAEFDTTIKRLQGVAAGYREARFTLASGQIVTLRVKDSGDIYQVLLNGQVRPIKNQADSVRAVGEIAKLAEGNQAKFQAAMARKKVDLPKGIKTAAPRIEVALQQRVAQLDEQIAERESEVAKLREELGESVMDGAGMSQKTETIEDHTDDLTEAASAQSAIDDEPGKPEGLAAPEAAMDGLTTTVVEDQTSAQKDALSAQTAMDSGDKESVTDGAGMAQLTAQVGDPNAAAVAAASAQAHLDPKQEKVLDGLKATIDLPMPADGNKSGCVTVDGDGTVASGPEGLSQAEEEIAKLITGKDEVINAALTIAGTASSGQTLDGADLSGAIANLQNALAIVENNYPINLAEGNAEQAALEQEHAASFRKALGVLGVLDAVPLLSKEAQSLLLKLYMDGSIADQDLPSAEARDELVEALYVVRDETGLAGNALTEEGRRAALEVMPVN